MSLDFEIILIAFTTIGPDPFIVGQLTGCLLHIKMFNLLFPLARSPQVNTPLKASYRSSWELLPGVWRLGVYVFN